MLSRSLLLALLITVSPYFVSAVELDPALEKEAQGIFSLVMSPFCPGRLLLDCPSSAATELKDRIRSMVVEGKGRNEILEHLYTIYGHEISALPAMRGFSTLAWIVPGVFLGAGLLIAIMWVKSRRAPATDASTPAQLHLDAEMLNRINNEVNRS